MATFIILRYPVTILIAAYTKTNKFDLAGPPRDIQEPDPLAVLHLDNYLFAKIWLQYFKW